MDFVSHGLVRQAAGPGPWDFTNKVLYDLCKQNPTHTRQDVVLAKMQIIGRVYAASMERRKNKKPEETTDSYYFSSVAPAILKSKLDDWIAEAGQQTLTAMGLLASW